MFQVELVWNREFDFVPHGKPHEDIAVAIKYAQSLENMGDGACVKKTRVVNQDGKIVFQHGKRVM